MPKKLVSLTCVILLCACLGGCQLAREDAGEDILTHDRFVGVYITFEHLDSTKDYYAKPAIIEEYGHETTTYEFDVPGIAFFGAKVSGEGNLEGYQKTISDDEIMDVHIGVHFNDDGEALELTGTIYMLEEKILHINLVYQTAVGDIYMLNGNAVYFGGSVSTTAEETMESKEGKFSAKVTVAMENVDEPEQEVFKEFDSNNEVIRSTVITPDNIPDTISLHSDCAYTIVETHSRGAEGLEITRILLDAEEKLYTYKYPGEWGFLVGKFIDVSNGN